MELYPVNLASANTTSMSLLNTVHYPCRNCIGGGGGGDGGGAFWIISFPLSVFAVSQPQAVSEGSHAMQSSLLSLSILNLLLLGLLKRTSAAAPTTAEVLSSYQQPECDEPLLRESTLPDSAFSATSNSEAMDQPAGEPSADHSAKAARNLVDGGWCPAGKVGRDFSEYIQIDMGTLNVIVKIAFGGRSGVGYTPSFLIRYTRETGNNDWRDYKNCSSASTNIIAGSESNLDLKLLSLNPPIIARAIRLYPYSKTPMFVCAKFEFYGCRFTDDLLEYKIPQGSLLDDPHLLEDQSGLSRSVGDADFVPAVFPVFRSDALRDRCYDGQRDPRGEVLHGGLGCLCDTRVASQNNVLALFDPYRQAGSEPSECLVGWNRGRWDDRSTGNVKALEFIFRFSGLRNFSTLYLHAVNLHSHQITLPHRLDATFDASSFTFADDPDLEVEFDSTVNATSILPTIKIDLRQKLGQFVRLRLSFAAQWIVLSELRFVSTEVDASSVEENRFAVGLPSEPIPDFMSDKRPIPEQLNTGDNYGGDLYEHSQVDPSLTFSRPPEDAYRGSTVLVLVLVFLCCFLGIMVGIACFSVSYMQKRKLRGDVDLQSPKLKARFHLPGLTISSVAGGQSVDTNYATINNSASETGIRDCGHQGANPQSNEQKTDLVLCANDAAKPTNSNMCQQTVSESSISPGRTRPSRGNLFASIASKFFHAKAKSPRAIVEVDRKQYDPMQASSVQEGLLENFSPNPSPTRGHSLNYANPVSPQASQLPPPGHQSPINLGGLQNPVSVHTVNGVIQVDLRRSHPSLLVNGHPIWRSPMANAGSMTNLERPCYIPHVNFFNTQHPHPVVLPVDSALYQSVQGESDADSLAASTMSPEYASASVLGGSSGVPFVPRNQWTLNQPNFVTQDVRGPMGLSAAGVQVADASGMPASCASLTYGHQPVFATSGRFASRNSEFFPPTSSQLAIANSRLRVLQDQGLSMWATATYDPQTFAWVRPADQSIYGLNFPVQHTDPSRLYGSSENGLQGSTSPDHRRLNMV
ncbi:DNA damage responsive protein [Sparganum proliferum]